MPATAKMERVPLPLQESPRLLPSAALGHKPLMLKEMQQKAPWNKPTVKKFSPDGVLAEVEAELAAAALASKPNTPRPLTAESVTLIDAFAQRIDQMNGLKVLDSKTNMARASALLRVEAWRRFDAGTLTLDAQRSVAAGERGQSYCDMTNLGSTLDGLVAVKDHGDAVASAHGVTLSATEKDLGRSRHTPLQLGDAVSSRSGQSSSVSRTSRRGSQSQPEGPHTARPTMRVGMQQQQHAQTLTAANATAPPPPSVPRVQHSARATQSARTMALLSTPTPRPSGTRALSLSARGSARTVDFAGAVDFAEASAIGPSPQWTDGLDEYEDDPAAGGTLVFSDVEPSQLLAEMESFRGRHAAAAALPSVTATRGPVVHARGVASPRAADKDDAASTDASADGVGRSGRRVRVRTLITASAAGARSSRSSATAAGASGETRQSVHVPEPPAELPASAAPAHEATAESPALPLTTPLTAPPSERALSASRRTSITFAKEVGDGSVSSRPGSETVEPPQSQQQRSPSLQEPSRHERTAQSPHIIDDGPADFLDNETAEAAAAARRPPSAPEPVRLPAPAEAPLLEGGLSAGAAARIAESRAPPRRSSSAAATRVRAEARTQADDVFTGTSAAAATDGGANNGDGGEMESNITLAADTSNGGPPTASSPTRPRSAPSSSQRVTGTRSFFPKLSGARLEELIRLQMAPVRLDLPPSPTFAPPPPALPIPTDPGPLDEDGSLQVAVRDQLHRECLLQSDALAALLPPKPYVPPGMFAPPLPTPAQLVAADLLALPPDPPDEEEAPADDSAALFTVDPAEEARLEAEAAAKAEAEAAAMAEAEAAERRKAEAELALLATKSAGKFRRKGKKAKEARKAKEAAADAEAEALQLTETDMVAETSVEAGAVVSSTQGEGGAAVTPPRGRRKIKAAGLVAAAGVAHGRAPHRAPPSSPVTEVSSDVSADEAEKDAAQGGRDSLIGGEECSGKISPVGEEAEGEAAAAEEEAAMQDAADNDELRQGVDHGSPWGEDEDSLLGGGTGSPKARRKGRKKGSRTAADGGALAAPAESTPADVSTAHFLPLGAFADDSDVDGSGEAAGAVAVPAGDRWVAPPDGLLHGVPVPVGSDYSSDYGGDIEDGAAGSSQAFASGGGYDDEVARWASRSDGIAGPAPARAPSASSSMAGAMGALASASGAGSPSDGPRHRLRDIDPREAFRYHPDGRRKDEPPVDEAGRYLYTPWRIDKGWLAPAAAQPGVPRPSTSPRNVASMAITAPLLQPKPKPPPPWEPDWRLEEAVARRESKLEALERERLLKAMQQHHPHGVQAPMSVGISLSRPDSARLPSGTKGVATTPEAMRPQPSAKQHPVKALDEDEFKEDRGAATLSPVRPSPSPPSRAVPGEEEEANAAAESPLGGSEGGASAGAVMRDDGDSDGADKLSTFEEAKMDMARQEEAKEDNTRTEMMLRAESEARAAYTEAKKSGVARLQHIWGALGVPAPQARGFLLRHNVQPGSGVDAYARAEKGLAVAVELWQEAAEAVLQREEALLNLIAFLQKVIDPERLLAKRLGDSSWRSQGSGAARGSQTSSPPVAAGNGSGSGEPSSSTAKRKQPAWLLKEARVRQGYEAKLTTAEARLMAALPRVEAVGDAVWFQGQLYRSKMRDDQLQMLKQMGEQAQMQRALRAPETEPFAPPGRPRPLSPRVPDTTTLAAVEVPLLVAAVSPSPRSARETGKQRPAIADNTMGSARGNWTRQGGLMRMNEPTALQQAYAIAGVKPGKAFLQR